MNRLMMSFPHRSEVIESSDESEEGMGEAKPGQRLDPIGSEDKKCSGWHISTTLIRANSAAERLRRSTEKSRWRESVWALID